MSTVLATDESTSFWQSQFAPRPTTAQFVFGVGFGVVLPAICLINDPIVFRASFGEPIQGKYIIVGGLAVALGFLTLIGWLTLRWPPALFAGMLAGGAIFATLLGIVMLPFSLIGLFALIGILGFAPFVTAFVFWRNVVRAFNQSRQSSLAGVVLALIVIGLGATCGTPWAAHFYVTKKVSHAMNLVMSDNAQDAERGINILRRYGMIRNYDQIVFAYETEKFQTRRDRLAVTYRELTGEEVEHRLSVLRD